VCVWTRWDFSVGRTKAKIKNILIPLNQGIFRAADPERRFIMAFYCR